jgi:cytochrome c oxidase subunit 4
MSNVRLYTVVYVLLMALAIGKVAFSTFFDGALELTLLMAAATVKSAMIVWYYQHLKWEPRSIKFVMAMGVFAVFLLTVAATFSLAGA